MAVILAEIYFLFSLILRFMFWSFEQEHQQVTDTDLQQA
jgi:hypothetical protein